MEQQTKQLPLRTSKKALAKMLEMAYTSELRQEIFTDEWLEVMGWTHLADYKTKRTFTIQQTRQIYAMLRVRKLLAA